MFFLFTKRVSNHLALVRANKNFTLQFIDFYFLSEGQMVLMHYWPLTNFKRGQAPAGFLPHFRGPCNRCCVHWMTVSPFYIRAMLAIRNVASVLRHEHTLNIQCTYARKLLRELYTVWRHGSVVRASVSDWRTFPDMRLIYVDVWPLCG